MDFHVVTFKNISSTNDYVKQELKKGIVKEGTVIMADYQSEGRGRGENIWYASPGMNLTFSVLFHPELNIKDHFFLTEFVSLALIDSLHTVGINAKVKWPNDIYVDNKKIAGLLIENILIHNSVESCVVGIGLNVNETKFPGKLPNPVSMKQLLKKEIDRPEILQYILENLSKHYNQLKYSTLENMHEEYNLKLFRIGEKAQYKSKGKLFDAIMVGTEHSGELVLKKNDRDVERFVFGEVEFIIK